MEKLFCIAFILPATSFCNMEGMETAALLAWELIPYNSSLGKDLVSP